MKGLVIRSVDSTRLRGDTKSSTSPFWSDSTTDQILVCKFRLPGANWCVGE